MKDHQIISIQFCRYCFEKYGVKTDQSDVILATLSAELQLSSNIVLINGLSDPWHTGSSAFMGKGQ